MNPTFLELETRMSLVPKGLLSKPFDRLSKSTPSKDTESFSGCRVLESFGPRSGPNPVSPLFESKERGVPDASWSRDTHKKHQKNDGNQLHGIIVNVHNTKKIFTKFLNQRKEKKSFKVKVKSVLKELKCLFELLIV